VVLAKSIKLYINPGGKVMKQSLLTRGTENKRFVRRQEGAQITSLGITKFDQVAIDAGAKIKLGNKIALYDIELICEYLKTLVD
jgi:hypothetical protein